MNATPYQDGETVEITLRGSCYHHIDGDEDRVAELVVAVETALGLFDVTVPLPQPTAATRPPVVVRRIAPADGPPLPGDVWEDEAASRWFVLGLTDRYGNTEVRLTRDGGSHYDVARVHEDYVLVRRLFRAEPVDATEATCAQVGDR